VLLDKHISDFHFNEVHMKLVQASPGSVYQVLWNTRFCDSFIIRALFWLRGLSIPRGTVQEFLENGFILIDDKPGEELVIGLLARVSGPKKGIVQATSTEFAGLPPAGFIKVGWNFKIQVLGQSQVRVCTETRIFCGSPKSKRIFGLYWFFIKPFSGLIRIEMLRLIAKGARLKKRS